MYSEFHLLDIKTRQELCKFDERNLKCAECRKLNFPIDRNNTLGFKTWCNEKFNCKYGLHTDTSSENFFEIDATPKIRNIWK